MTSPPLNLHKSHFYIFGAEDVPIPDMALRCKPLCRGKGFWGEIECVESNPVNGSTRSYVLSIRNHSGQGVGVHVYLDDCPQTIVYLRSLSTPGDVALAFSLLECFREMRPQCNMVSSRDTQACFTPTPDELENLTERCIQNWRDVLAVDTGNKCKVIKGLHHNCYVCSDGVYPPSFYDEYDDVWEDDIRYWDGVAKPVFLGKECFEVIDRFIELQWLYEDYNTTPLSRITMKNGTTFTGRIIDNISDVFVGKCDKIILSSRHLRYYKIMSRSQFLWRIHRNDYFHKVDDQQFVMRKMPLDEWHRIMEYFPGYNPHKIHCHTQVVGR